MSVANVRDGAAAYRAIAQAKRARWGAVAAEVGTDVYRPEVSAPFSLRDDDAIFAIGSCFAQEVQQVMIQQGAKVVSWVPPERAICDRPEFFEQHVGEARHFWPAHFLHRYTPASLRQEIEHLLGLRPDLEAGGLLLETTAGVVDLHYHTAFPLPTREDCIARRAWLRSFFASLRSADVFIMTLGLIETWSQNDTGLVANIAPPYPARDFAVRVPAPEDVLRDLYAVIGLLRAANPAIKIVFTVSPIPLDATFLEPDVLVATTRGKSTLIAAARQVVSTTEAAMYFPSFEMVSGSDPSLVWMPDRRHVRSEFVSEIMAHFRAALVERMGGSR